MPRGATGAGRIKIQEPSGSSVYIGCTGVGRGVARRRTRGRTARRAPSDERGLDGGCRSRKTGRPRDSDEKEAAGVGDKLDAEGEGGESKITSG